MFRKWQLRYFGFAALAGTYAPHRVKVCLEGSYYVVETVDIGVNGTMAFK